MRRVLLAIVGTVTGLVLLLSFKSHPAGTVGAIPPAVAAPPSTSGTGTTPRPEAGSTSASRTLTGGTANTPYGPVQVQVTVAGGRITGVQALQFPSDARRSRQISSFAVPQLTQEALSAQSAHIDLVSGATYTSEGYAASLQSALDQAGHQ